VVLNDGTRVTTAFDASGRLATEVYGTVASILDIGELLAWLGANLQQSSDPLSHKHVCPSILTQISPTSSHKSPSIVNYISFGTVNNDNVLREPSTPNGRCWHQLFRNPIIVKEYPISPKARPGSGIEIPLNIMATLVGSGQIDEFDGKSFIKGFSKMLVPVEKDGNVIYWHLYRSENQDRIPFWNPTTSHAAYIDSLQMGSCRHIVGWTLDAEFHAGISPSAIAETNRNDF
jgi:hypothetical protein